MQYTGTSLQDALLLELPAFADPRGLFVKTFHAPSFREAGISFSLYESYYSVSGKDVIRGMHFQLPPHQHSKIVYCPYGAILDVIVDLRAGSPTFGHFEARELSAANNLAFYIPEGFAHGFKSLADGAVTCYLVSSAYSRDHDAGIRYDSFGFDWGVRQPVLSDRDLAFPAMKDFSSPF